MTPEELIQNLNEVTGTPEVAHLMADYLLTEYFERNGMHDVAVAFQNVQERVGGFEYSSNDARINYYERALKNIRFYIMHFEDVHGKNLGDYKETIKALYAFEQEILEGNLWFNESRLKFVQRQYIESINLIYPNHPLMSITEDKQDKSLLAPVVLAAASIVALIYIIAALIPS